MNQSVRDLADFLAADSVLLLEIERGEADIQKLGADDVAAWSSHLQVPAEAAIEALRATFLVRTVNQAAAPAKVELNDEQNQFVEEVARAFSHR